MNIVILAPQGVQSLDVVGPAEVFWEAARRLGVTQPRISDLLRGKITLFGLDTLVNMAVAAGLQVEMRIGKAA